MCKTNDKWKPQTHLSHIWPTTFLTSLSPFSSSTRSLVANNRQCIAFLCSIHTQTLAYKCTYVQVYLYFLTNSATSCPHFYAQCTNKPENTRQTHELTTTVSQTIMANESEVCGKERCQSK